MALARSLTVPVRARQTSLRGRRMRRRAVLALLATGIWTALLQAAPVLTGKIVDADGGPLADVEVAQFWLAGSGDPAGFRAYGATKSDSQGGFELKVGHEHYPATLF